MPTPEGISGSRSAGVLGLSVYQTQVKAWLIICEQLYPGFCAAHNYTCPPFEDNAAIRFGLAFENEIIKFAEKKYNTRFKAKQKLFKKDYLTCHPDGIMNDTLIEVKTVSKYSYENDWDEDPASGKIPIFYMCQVQHNMYLCDLEKCIMPVLIFPETQAKYEEREATTDKINIKEWVNVLNQMGLLKFYEIERHDELLNLMLAKYEKFWNENVLKQIEPEPVSVADFRLLYPDVSGTILATEQIERLVAERKNIQEEIGDGGSLAKRSEMIKVELLRFMKSAEHTLDEESEKRWILRGRDGSKLATYGKNKAGQLYFR